MVLFDKWSQQFIYPYKPDMQSVMKHKSVALFLLRLEHKAT